MYVNIKANRLAAAVCLLALACGCGQAAAAAEGTVPENAAEGAAQTICGKIKEINGNEILLALGDYSAAAEQTPPGENAPSGGRSLPDGEAGENAAGQQSRPERSGQMPEAGDAPGGEGGRGRPGGGWDTGEAGGTGLEQGGMPGGMGSFTLSGEERTLLIPVTAAITTGQGENAKEIRFTQLAVKNVVRLGLDEQGEIVSVSVLE